MFEKLRSHLSGFYEKLSKSELGAGSLDKFLSELKMSLIESDVAVPVAEEICSRLKKDLEGAHVGRFEDRKAIIRKSMRESLRQILDSHSPVDVETLLAQKRSIGEPLVVVFAGINGTGKTTTIAKLARFFTRQGYSTVLACSDTYRSGAIEQLEEHARRVGVKMIKHKYGSDAAAVAFDTVSHARANRIHVVLIDTAGRMGTNMNLLDEMKKIVRVSNPDLVLLVVDSLAGNDAAEQGRVFSEAVRIDGVVLTKLDADAKGGSALSISYVTGKPVVFLGTGQSYDDIALFKPEMILERILP